MSKRAGPGQARTKGTVTAIPEFEIPEVMDIFRDKEDPRLFETFGLSYLAYDLVYDERGYSTADPAYEFAPPRYAGAAAKLARELAPLVGWPCACAKRERIEPGENGFSTYHLEVFCNGNPWIAPWQALQRGPTPYIERNGKAWARGQFSRVSRLIQGVVEVLAFFDATGQAVLPRQADERARTRYVRGGSQYDFYPRIQDIESEYIGWSRW